MDNSSFSSCLPYSALPSVSPVSFPSPPVPLHYRQLKTRQDCALSARELSNSRDSEGREGERERAREEGPCKWMSAVISSVGRGEWFGCNYTGLLLQTGGGGVKVVTGNKQSCLSDKTMTSALHRSSQYGQTNNFSCQKQETGNQTRRS